TPYTAPSPSSRAAAPVGWKDSAATARSRARAGAAPTWRRSNSGPEVVRRAVHQWTGVILGGAKGLSVASAQRRAAWLRLSLTDARSQPAPARPPVPLPSRRGQATGFRDRAPTGATSQSAFGPPVHHPRPGPNPPPSLQPRCPHAGLP